MAQFQIKRSSGGAYYFHLLSTGNNKVILRGEGYTTRKACEHGINSVKENAPHDDQYDRLFSRDRQYYFNLRATNGKIIGTSETYTSEANRDHGIELVKEQAPSAEIVDLF